MVSILERYRARGRKRRLLARRLAFGDVLVWCHRQMAEAARRPQTELLVKATRHSQICSLSCYVQRYLCSCGRGHSCSVWQAKVQFSTRCASCQPSLKMCHEALCTNCVTACNLTLPKLILQDSCMAGLCGWGSRRSLSDVDRVRQAFQQIQLCLTRAGSLMLCMGCAP